ncbi:MAG: DUF7793 family protein [Bacteroidota bacterium]
MLLKSEKIKTNVAEIWIDEQELLRVDIFEGAELNLEEVIICFDSYRELGCGPNNRVLQLMDARVNCTMTKEARDYVAKHAKAFFIASAVVSDNLVVRLIANFINKFYQLDVPLKLFHSEEKALEWLMKFRK